MAVRGHKETEGKLQQLLMMLSIHDSGLKRWVKESKCMSPVIVTELITFTLLRSLLTNITASECSPAWYAIIVDETTDFANRKQLNLSIRWVSNDYEVSEDSVGLYCFPNTTSDTFYTVVTDILTWCSYLKGCG